jgi:pimeloyl-ACP methyl ester carboxylesterase
MPPKTRYAKSGTVSIAFQVVGEGALDLVLVPGFVSNVEYIWELPGVPRLLNHLASFTRLILFDKRGTGLSDPVTEVPSLEQRMEDLCAVLDAVGSQKAALWGVSEGGPMSLLFAVTHPERTDSLVLYGAFPRFSFAPDFPWGFKPDAIEQLLRATEAGWGEGGLLSVFAPSVARDPAMRRVFGGFQRTGASPAMARAVLEALVEIDVRNVLGEIRAPTLLLHRVDDRAIPVENSRYMAERIPGAKLVELEGMDHLIWLGGADDILEEIGEFLTGTRAGRAPDRVLATVLFMDIVDSTERARELGDRRWRDLLDRYLSAVRRELKRFGGREMDTAGDGFFAAFDAPARAIQCARAILDAVGGLGIAVRTGMHTGECEVIGEKVGGIAVHIGARVMAMARPGEVVVSGTVKDLVAGSHLRFADRGTHALKGVPGEWRLYAVEG